MVTECVFLTCTWRFLLSNRLEQLEFKLEKKHWNLEIFRKRKYRIYDNSVKNVILSYMTLWRKQFNLKPREISRNEKSPHGKIFPKANGIFLHLEICSIFLPYQLMPEQKKRLRWEISAFCLLSFCQNERI